MVLALNLKLCFFFSFLSPELKFRAVWFGEKLLDCLINFAGYFVRFGLKFLPIGGLIIALLDDFNYATMFLLAATATKALPIFVAKLFGVLLTGQTYNLLKLWLEVLPVSSDAVLFEIKVFDVAVLD